MSGARGLSSLCRSRDGQMAVEMAVLMPVCIVCALVVFNLCRFVEACATFDRVALDAVISQGTDLSRTSSSSAGRRLAACITDTLAMRSCEVSVVAQLASSRADAHTVLLAATGTPVTYVCTLRYRPWPASFIVAGLALSPPLALVHERRLVVCAFGAGTVV